MKVSVESKHPNGTGWYIRHPEWVMQPIGKISADEAERICKLCAAAISPPSPRNVTESIYASNGCIIPLADVQHIETHNPLGLIVVTKHTRWDTETGAWANHIWIAVEEANAFKAAWCRYRSELEAAPSPNGVSDGECTSEEKIRAIAASPPAPPSPAGREEIARLIAGKHFSAHAIGGSIFSDNATMDAIREATEALTKDIADALSAAQEDSDSQAVSRFVNEFMALTSPLMAKEGRGELMVSLGNCDFGEHEMLSARMALWKFCTMKNIPVEMMTAKGSS